MKCLSLLLAGLLAAMVMDNRGASAAETTAETAAAPQRNAPRVLDDFGEKSADDVAAWVAGEQTPPIERFATDEPGIKVIAPFAAQPGLARAVVDRRVKLDLAAPGEFTLEVSSDLPEPLAHLTLYFRSGDGWYGAGGNLRKQGWQTLRFSKAAFRAEGTPAGWQKIDGIRIAAWRSQAKDTWLGVRRLTAVTHDVALVVPDAAGPDADEVRSARQTAELLAGMLSELGLGSDAVDEEAVTHGALGDRQVAILAHNPQLSGEAIAALGRFVDAGGKLLVCYSLPPELGQLLGFGETSYVRQQRPGDFADVRFDAADVPGLPGKVAQASWNITVAEPTGHNARVIGRWYDDAGKPTVYAAMLLSDRGAFFSHIILADDRPGKKQLLAAVLGKLAPPLWRQMAQAEIDRIAEVGRCHSLPEVVAHIHTHGNALANSQLNAAIAVQVAARASLAKEDYPQAVAEARSSHDALAEVYLLAQDSPAKEGRAMWNHSGTGAYPGDWERSCRELAAAGFNMVLPNMLWGGRAHYASDVLPRSATFDQYGDQIEQCCKAAKRHGVQVHVWKVNYNLSGAPRDFVARLREQGRLQRTPGGEEHPWLCPSHPDNRQLELQSMLEVARKYPVDGLHFDYIRYPGRETCYCDGCRARFEAESGTAVADWPRDCYAGPRREEYNDWRCRQITWLVAAVHREAKKLRGEIKISAAVFGSYPSCRASVAQDWPVWVKEGYLDFLCPMDYTESDLFFSSLIESQQRLVGGRIPIYPGIGATASNATLSPDRVVGQIHLARSLGTAGFTIFNFQRGTAEEITPAVGRGAGSQKAVPPH